MPAVEEMMEVTEGLAQLDPVGTYAQRSAELVSKYLGAASYRLERLGMPDVAGPKLEATEPTISLPLRNGRTEIGTLHLFMPDSVVMVDQDLETARWASRLLARGLQYSNRLTNAAGRRAGEAVQQTLRRAPLTPRERDVVSLLVAGSSTRDIASRTGLTVSTVNTYLKRIFSKLGVHSRVELIAKMAGTDGLASLSNPRRAQSTQRTDR